MTVPGTRSRDDSEPIATLPADEIDPITDAPRRWSLAARSEYQHGWP
jgi:hypothetical protein